MQIFYLHYNPKKCAKMHVNKHVIKCILETAQLLCGAHYMTNSKYIPPYRITHKNHPCAIWTRTSIENYKWLCKLGLELCKEYTYRYKKIHKTQQHIEKLSENIPPIENYDFTLPAQAMPEKYKIENNPIEAYRLYYFFDKFKLHDWKNRLPPKWLIKHYINLC
jgi:hypothetical protein